jgi:hypothetical protein
MNTSFHGSDHSAGNDHAVDWIMVIGIAIAVYLAVAI